MRFKAFYNHKVILVCAETPEEAQRNAAAIFKTRYHTKIAVFQLENHDVRINPKEKYMRKSQKNTKALSSSTNGIW